MSRCAAPERRRGKSFSDDGYFRYFYFTRPRRFFTMKEADESNIESCVGHEILFSVNCNSCIQRTQSPIKNIATLEGIDEHIFYIEAEELSSFLQQSISSRATTGTKKVSGRTSVTNDSASYSLYPHYLFVLARAANKRGGENFLTVIPIYSIQNRAS